MKATFISTEGEYLEACIKVDGQELHVMDTFRGETIPTGTEIDIEVTVGLTDDEESWESMFSGNPKKVKMLERLSGWRYRVYGIITSINPVKVDCGLLLLDGPIVTHDERVIGEPIAFTITRMDAYS
jgi:hypothetical protein